MKQRQQLIDAAIAEARAVYPNAGDQAIAAQAVVLLARRAMTERDAARRDLYEGAAIEAQRAVRELEGAARA